MSKKSFYMSSLVCFLPCSSASWGVIFGVGDWAVFPLVALVLCWVLGYARTGQCFIQTWSNNSSSSFTIGSVGHQI